VRLEGLRKFKNHLIGYRTHDLSVCSTVPEAAGLALKLSIITITK
jgi:hypothetical protein